MSLDENSPNLTEENQAPPHRLKPSVGVLIVPVLLLYLMVEVILVIVIGIGILTTSGEGIVSERHFKYKGTPSIQFKSGEIISAVGVFYSIEKGDRVKKARWSLIYEINGRPVNAWNLYLQSIVRYTLPPVLVLMLFLVLGERFLERFHSWKQKNFSGP